MTRPFAFFALAALLGCAGPSQPTPRASPVQGTAEEEEETDVGLEPAPDEFADAGVDDADAATPDPQGPAATAAPEPVACGPREGGTHCIVFDLVRPSATRAAALAAHLTEDGFHASAAEDRVELVGTDEEISHLLHARVVYATHAASATDAMICEAELDGIRIPRRYRRVIAHVAVGHQECE